MEDKDIMPADRKQKMEQEIAKALESLRLAEARRPMDFALQLGYAVYVRLFVEAQRRPGLQQHFPYGGFLMQWTRAEEPMERSQRVWELQYQVRYCASIVEEGHFMEKAVFTDRGDWAEQISRLVDLAADGCGWQEEPDWDDPSVQDTAIPEDFGWLLEETVRQIVQQGNSGCFLLSRPLMELMADMADIGGEKRVWNPGCRTGGFLKLLFAKNPALQLAGSEEEKDFITLARMLRFCFGGGQVQLRAEDPLKETGKEQYDVIFANPPVGEVEQEAADRFPVSTRKIPLQYLQMMMKRLAPGGMALAVVNESVLFRYDAEQKVRKRLAEERKLEGVLSLPAGALLPYTAAKASLLIFSRGNTEKSAVWFYEAFLPDAEEQKKAAEGTDPRILTECEAEAILSCWRRRDALYQKWRAGLTADSRLNKWENPVPAGWEEACWFADPETIRKNDYNLTAGRYKPWQEEAPLPEGESPTRLLLELAAMEKESAAKIQELIEMTKKYE